ncbi:MAG: hypothetical protein BI182_05785 [Acetobacterium sp. MES1]|uniref:hypothetical protein n=1 Tax=Acetobacterium sp. MES1 TaxID=1899015 RepID=UPI000B9CA60A|nr:hypothetical protein [Acetobacterium sp. MES1]OXS25240.1 MAG: hypothetical protein BI182_05785 [Acetobacterium sp. MES1]
MKKMSASLIGALFLSSMVFSTNVFAAGIETKTAGDIGVTYRTHIQNEGWLQGWMVDGAMSGSEGKGLRLEAIEIELTGDVPDDLKIQYQTHIENEGWAQGWVTDGALAGSEGKGLRLEAVEIRLTGASASDYSVKYRTQIENEGWAQGWVADGALSGSEGKGLRLEAIEIMVVETPVKIAYDAYQDVLNQASEADYTVNSWTTYKKIVDANVVTKDDTANRITEATIAIKTAQESLVKKADLTVYHDVLNSVMEEQCTPESWAIYRTIVEANVVTAEDPQEKVDAATIAIIKAQKELVKYANMSAYNTAVTAISEDQVKSGWTEYKEVLDANHVTKLNTQDEVDAATAKIVAAQKNLVLYSNLGNFNKVIALYIEFGTDADNAPYSRESWDAYTTVCETYGTLNNGTWVYDVISKNSDQTAIDSATADIKKMTDVLVATADLKAFNAAKNIKITDGPYTTASFEAYTKNAQVISIADLEADLLKSYSQSVVDGYTQTLIAIQHELLIHAADLSAYNEALAKVKAVDYTEKTWATYQTIVDTNKVDGDSTQEAVNAATAKILSAQKNLTYSAAYVAANSRLDSYYFGVRKVGDNILTRANELISAAGFDKTRYKISFTRIDNGTAVINPVTGLITDAGATTASVSFTITPVDGSEAATTKNIDLFINK